jgi:hypothetical protein
MIDAPRPRRQTEVYTLECHHLPAHDRARGECAAVPVLALRRLAHHHGEPSAPRFAPRTRRPIQPFTRQGKQMNQNPIEWTDNTSNSAGARPA